MSEGSRMLLAQFFIIWRMTHVNMYLVVQLVFITAKRQVEQIIWIWNKPAGVILANRGEEYLYRRSGIILFFIVYIVCYAYTGQVPSVWTWKYLRNWSRSACFLQNKQYSFLSPRLSTPVRKSGSRESRSIFVLMF